MPEDAQTQASNTRKTLDQRAQMSDIERLRHSCAHVMASAVLRLWKDAQLAGGPPVENGFYYDMELEHRITPEDFPAIEAEMQKIIKENQSFQKTTISRSEAIVLAENGRLGALTERAIPSKFKRDLIDAIPEDEEISLFQNGDFLDLCAGPHVPRTGNCKAFKLMSVASAFYKGDAANPQLQRLYGTCFKNKTQLNEHLEALEEAKKRDHRKLGKELDLFHIDDAVGQGLVLWKPKGAIIRNELQKFITKHLDAQGYQQVYTPHIGKLDLYRTSGHFPYYSESQYPPIIERSHLEKLAEENCSCAQLHNHISDGEVEGFLLKPMNCPHHIKIYDSSPHSYRDLPVRLAEFGTVYRWEQSGEIGGLTRVRGFTQDDAHLFCTPEQLSEELHGCLQLVKTVFSTLELTDYRVRIGLRDPDATKYVGDPSDWDKAENALRETAATLGVPATEEAGEAAFYGPKIDFVVRDVIGREWQLGTVQVDYNLPKRFDLHYIDADNQKKRPVMIHRAPFGSLERFVGILIEHFAGKFPTWLSPEQIRVLPISEKYLTPAQKVLAQLKEKNLRSTLDNSAEKIGAKIRNARLERIPYMIILGEKEQETGTLSIRHRDQGDLGQLPLDTFLEKIKTETTL